MDENDFPARYRKFRPLIFAFVLNIVVLIFNSTTLFIKGGVFWSKSGEYFLGDINDRRIRSRPSDIETEVKSGYILFKEDGETSSASIVGMGFDYPLIIYQRFVGSLRKTGFVGHIILGVGPEAGIDVLGYLNEQNVTIRILKNVPCEFDETKLCFYPYSSMKKRWSKFVLAKDWLTECTGCTGPSLLSDIHDNFFQTTPFGKNFDDFSEVLIFEEHPHNFVRLSIVGQLLKSCKKFEVSEFRPLLSAGNIIAPVELMVKFLGFLHVEIIDWLKYPSCQHTEQDKDTKALINYLVMAGKIPSTIKTRIISHRSEIIVHNVGYEGHIIRKSKMYLGLYKGKSEKESDLMPFEGANETTWLDSEYYLTDEYGYFINLDFIRSSIVHEYYCFGNAYVNWLDKRLKMTLSVKPDGWNSTSQ